IKSQMVDDIGDKLDLTGGTLAGDLTVKDNLKVEATAYLASILPSEDNKFSLGSSSSGWENLYIHRMYGSSPIIVGDGSSSHSLDSTGDFIISGILETNGIAYFDGEIILNDQRISGLENPQENRDAATKEYVDNQIGTSAFMERIGSMISPTNHGDTLDMASGAITNIGSLGSFFSATGGLNLADSLFVQSGGLNVVGDSIVTGMLSGLTSISAGTGNLLSLTAGNVFISGNIIQASNDSGLALYNNGSKGIFIDDDGNVGVGTENPVGRLSVAGSQNENAYFFYDNDDVGNENSGQSLYVYRRASEGDKYLRFYVNLNGAPIITSNHGTIFYGANVGLLTNQSQNFGGSNQFSMRYISSADRFELRSSNIDGLGTSGTIMESYYNTNNAIFKGNVGIGTTSPVRKLDIYDEGSNGRIGFHTNLTGSGVSDGTIIGPTENGNFYIWNYENAIVNIGTNGESRLYIKGDGNIGIGKASPLKKLDIAGDGINLENTFSSSTGIIFKDTNRFIHNFQHPTGDTAIPDGYNTFVGVGTGNFTMGITATSNEHGSRNTAFGYNNLRLNTTGYRNTAIGTNSLQANTTGYRNTAIGGTSLYNNTTGYFNTAGGEYSLPFNTTGNYNTAYGAHSLHDLTEGISNVAIGYETGRGITIGNYNTIIGANVKGLNADLSNNIIIADGEGNRRINVDGGGKVGIGTTSPNSLLQLGELSGVSPAVGMDEFIIAQNNSVAGMSIWTPDASAGFYNFGSPSDAHGAAISWKYDDNLFRIFTASTGAEIAFESSNKIEAVRIDNAGKVGIGTTDPVSKLEVSGGDIRVTGGSFIDDGTTLTVPDYVFEPNYGLMPLSDLKNYITANKHLPGIPDMRDRARWALLSLQDRDMKLLEKTEENTLYVIDLDSQLATHNSQLTNLQAQSEKLKVQSEDLIIQTGDVDSQVSNLNSQIEDLNSQLATYSSQLAILEDQVQQIDTELINTQLNELMDFMLAINASEFIRLGETNKGNLLLDGKLETEETETKKLAIKIKEKESATIGTSVICPKDTHYDEDKDRCKDATDEDEDGIDEESGKSVSTGVSTSVITSAVTADSKIFITIKNAELAIPVKIGKIENGEGFEIEINEPTESRIDLDWWIVGTE
ncbi:MAG: hypothetical protein WCR65_03305, partial [Parcubacteria group bacterium]